MPHVTNRLFQTPLIDGFPALLFQTLVVFSLIQSCRGQTVVTGSSEPIVGIVGGEVVLPCYLEPAMPAFDMTVEWTRPDLDRRFVLVRRDGEELQNKKHQSYEGRTSLFSDELKNGNISLKLSKVKLSDKGLYRCYVPGWKSETTVELVVATPSSPVVTIAAKNASISGVVLQVQQSNTSQTRETQIHVPDYFFPDQPKSSSSSGSSVLVIIIGLIVGVVFILAAVLFVWKWRKNKRENKKHNKDEETQRVREDKTKSTESEKEPLLELKQTDSGHVTPETESVNIQPKEEEKKDTESKDHETEVQCPVRFGENKSKTSDSENEPMVEVVRETSPMGNVPPETVKKHNEMETQTANNVQTKEDEEETEFKDHETEVQFFMDEEQHGEEVKDRKRNIK
ncbi:butyrophilin subfamily 3 member A2-like [Anabas testudineus]|uniref:butyrophilin subfamily 3 member A2-like n=1 Tax=Anabas testudineus TaxID=64144 RepID=UPI00143CD380|nr:butyrophilin subfamily 3 member A2-like [Anabas testudineus]